MLRSCLILISLLTASTALANSSVVIKSLSTGQDPFVIVYESKKNETDLPPGIYAQTKGKEKLELILPGKIADIGGGFNGILAPFPKYSSYSGREEHLVILDGKLTIFSNRTDEKKKDSFVVIGSKQYPLVDALTGQEVELENLNSTEMVEVVYSDSELGINMLVSIKQKNHFGTGLTFVIHLPARKSNEHIHELKLVRPPTIIDYNYLTKQELQHLINQDSIDRNGFSSVLSRLHLLQLQQPKRNDNPLLVEWKKFLSEVDKQVKTSPVNTIENKGSNSVKLKPVPYYNFRTDTLLLANYPAQLLVAEPFPVIFRADPIHGHSGLFFSNGFYNPDELQAKNVKADLLGNVDYDAQKKEYKIWLPTASKKGERSVNNMLFASVDNSLHALFRGGERPITHYNLGRFLRSGQGAISPEEIRSLSFAHRVANHSSALLHHIVVSYKTTSNESETVVFILSEGLGPIQIQAKYSLGNKYYSQAELDRRILTKSAEFGGVDHVLFDTIGEPAPSNKTKKTPYLNLTSSTHETLKQSYLQALEHVDLNKPHFVYREYNEQGAFSKKSGFYLVTDQNVTETLAIDVSDSDEEKQSRIFIPGKLLRKPKMKKGQNSLDYKVLSGTSAGDLVATLYANNPNPNSKNTENFQAIIDLETQGDKKKTRPTLHAIDLPFSFDRLQAVKIIQGRRDSVNSFSAVFFVAADDQAGVRKGQPGVYVVPMTISSEYKGDFQAVSINSSETPSWVNRMEIQPNELKDRIAFDGKGRTYWIINPKMQRHMPNFSVYPLEKPSEQIYTHRQDTRVNLKPNEFLDDSESNVTGFQFSNWLLYSNSDIRTRFPKFKPHFDAVEKNKRKFKRRILFPALNEYLEVLASPDSKKEHIVLLVEDKFKDDFMKYILTRMMLNEDGLWSTVSEKGRKQFNPHVIDASVTVKDVRNEMEILSVPRKDRRNLVFLDAATIFAAMGLQHTVEEKEAKNIKEEDDEGEDEGDEATEDKDGTSSKKAADAPVADPKTGTTTTVAESDPSAAATLHLRGDGNEEQEDEELLASEAPQYLFRNIALEGRATSVKTLLATPEEERFKVPTLIVATPQEWRALQTQLPKEDAEGIFDTFNVNPQFLTSSWTVWPAQSGRSTEEIRNFSQTPISKEEFHVFKALEEILLDSADKTKQAQHRIIVVPDELKSLINKLIMSRWASENKSVSGAWNFSNPDLALFKVDPVRPLQSKVFDNYEAMKGSLSSRRPVLIGDLGDILKIGRPSPAENQKIYRIKDPAIAKKDLMDFDQDSEAEISTDKAQLPHMMWLIAAEGEEVQPLKAADWSINSTKPKTIPTNIIATAKELATLKVDTAFEGRFIDWQKEFDIVNLNEPTTDVKIELLQGLFRRHDIESLNYKFANPADSSEADPRMAILSSIVSSTLYYARNTKMEPTAAFLRVFTEFRRALTEDNELRRSRVITPIYIDRLFARVFPIPLNYKTFEENDATRKLLDPNSFMHEMSEAGYDAPAELKMKAIDAWNRKTRSTVAGRNVPSSMVFFGGTSTGKTFLFDTFMHILNLKEYRMDHPTNDDAGFIKIKVENLTEEKVGEGDSKNINVDDALAHIENLMCQPKGPQAHILFDDLHKAKSTLVLKKIIAFTERLFEAKDGIMRVKCLQQEGKKAEYREIPVRNITLALTINPTADKEKKERFEHAGDVVSRIIAALAREDYSIEDSYFARFSTILNMDEFPRDAKVSSLARAIRDANRQEFGSGRHFVMVAPSLLDSVVESFPKANAREFLNAATHNMANIPQGIEPAPLYIKDISRSTEGGKVSWDFRSIFSAKQIDSDRIDAVLQDRIALRPVTQNDITSKVEFMSVIVNSFRVRVYEELLMAGKEDPRLIGNPDLRETVLVSFMLASISNMMNNTHVPLKRVRAISDDFNASNDAQRRQFEQHMGELSKNDAAFFKLNIPPVMDMLDSDIDSFLNGGSSKPPQRTRRIVLSETAADLNEALRPLMSAFFRVPNIQGFHNDRKEWFSRLDEKEPKELLKNVSAKMMSIYFKYRNAILDSNVLESFEDKQVALNDYDIARMFYLCLDRALVDLPWGPATQFTVDVVDLATRQMQLGQIPEFQHFAFVSNFSPLFAQTPQNVITFGASVKEYRDYPEKDKGYLVTNFDNNCERFLSKEGGSK